MATRIPNNIQNVAVDAVVDLIDAGTGAGTMEVRTGSQPADADDAATGTLLATVTLADPAYGAAAGGVAALAGTPRSDIVDAAGTAGWFRVKDSNGATVYDGAIRATADSDLGEELVLDNKVLAVGQSLNINSLNFSLPASE